MPLDKKHLVKIADGALSNTDLDAVFAAVNSASRVVLHFHGGLVHEEVAEKSAAELVDDYVEDGKVHPVFWVWNSGFLQMQDEVAEFIERPEIRLAIRWLVKLHSSLSAGHPIAAHANPPDKVSAIFAGDPPIAQLPGVLERIRQRRGEREMRMIVVEELLRERPLGKRMQETWQDIKDVIERAFDPAVAGAGGLAFLERLRHAWSDKHRFTLVCHSAGAIYALRFLKAADAVLPAFAQFDLVLLAPACTFTRLFSCRDVLRRRVRSLQMFALKDERERAVNKIYPGSILYLISGLLEEKIDQPLVGMQRYHVGHSNEPDILTVRRTFDNATVWSPSTEAPLASDAVTHRDFDDADRSTMSSVYKLLSGQVAAPPFQMP